MPFNPFDPMQPGSHLQWCPVLGPKILLPISCVNMRWKNCVLLPSAGWRTQFFTSYSRNQWEIIFPAPEWAVALRRQHWLLYLMFSLSSSFLVMLLSQELGTGCFEIVELRSNSKHLPIAIPTKGGAIPAMVPCRCRISGIPPNATPALEHLLWFRWCRHHGRFRHEQWCRHWKWCWDHCKFCVFLSNEWFV